MRDSVWPLLTVCSRSAAAAAGHASAETTATTSDIVGFGRAARDG